MKQAHKYKLIVKWSDKPEWSLTVLALDAESVTLWLPQNGSPNMENEDTFILSVEIRLLERNVEQVKDGFIAKGLD